MPLITSDQATPHVTSLLESVTFKNICIIKSTMNQDRVEMKSSNDDDISSFVGMRETEYRIKRNVDPDI